MDELDAILNDLQSIAKDVGFEVSTTATASPASTTDTGFEDSYNYSTVKRAPPKTPKPPPSPVRPVTPPPPPKEEVAEGNGDFGLDKILASLEELDKKPMPPTRPRPSPKPDSIRNHGPIIKAEPVLPPPTPPPTALPSVPPPPPKLTETTTTKPPPPATPPRTTMINDKYATRNPSPRPPPGQPPQPLATIFRHQLGHSKKMERTSSYSSDQSDRSSNSIPPGPPHSPGYRTSFPPPGRAIPPPPPPPVNQPVVNSGYYPPKEEIPLEKVRPPVGEYMELSAAFSQKKSSPAISIHTDISRDSGFASQDAEYIESSSSTHYRQLGLFNEPTASTSDCRVQIFSNEGSYKWIPIERQMTARYVTQIVAEKHRLRFTARHSLLEYNPHLATERILEEDEKVVEVVNQWGGQKNELHFFERADKWLLFANPQVLMDRATAEKAQSREERHRLLEQWFPPNLDVRYPGDPGGGPRIAETVQMKDDKKNKWREKYIELRKEKLFIFKKESNREKQPEDVIDMREFLVYRSLNWNKQFKSPPSHPNGICVKMGHVQNFGQCKKGSPTERIKFFALENEFSELKWVTALRLVKEPKRLLQNYTNTMKSVEQRPSSLLSLRPGSLGPVMGPLPSTSSVSRPSSIDSHDQTDFVDTRPHHHHHHHPARTYVPTGQHQMAAPPAPPPNHHGSVMMRERRLVAPPMTRYYEQPVVEQVPSVNPNHHQPRINDFPPPPLFVTELKDVSRRAASAPSQDQDFEHLPPPPPELILQEARNNNMENGYRTISNRPRPPPPSRIQK